MELCQDAARFDAGIRTDLPLLIGKAYYLSKSYEVAAHYLRKSVQVSDTPAARQYLAEIAIQNRDWDRAEIESQRGTVLDPPNSHLYYLLARSLKAQGKTGSALEMIDYAINLIQKPRGYYYYIKGQLHQEQFEWDKAIRSWQKGSLLEPRNANYLLQIARVYSKKNENESAERYYLSALALNPDNENIRKELAKLRKRK